MTNISPFLWFDHQAGDAAKFYESVFPGAKIKSKNSISETPSGNVEVYVMQIYHQEFQLMSAGPLYVITPAISFFIHCESAEEVDDLWGKLLTGGKVRMEVGEYPYSKRYGWIEDKFGVSWQLILMPAPMPKKIAPSLLFVNEKFGKANEAIEFYTAIFPDSKIVDVHRAKNQPPYADGMVTYGSFMLSGNLMAALDGPGSHAFDFSEAISLMVNCETQEEVDRYWELLTKDGTEVQCGWLKDKFGVSWQVVPRGHEMYVGGPDPEGAKRAMQAMLGMKKLDIHLLKKAYEGH